GAAVALSGGISGASAAGTVFVLAASAALFSERRSGAGGTNEDAGAGALGAGAIAGALTGGASRVLLASLGAWRDPRELLTSWNVPSTSSSTPMPSISRRRRF